MSCSSSGSTCLGELGPLVTSLAAKYSCRLPCRIASRPLRGAGKSPEQQIAVVMNAMGRFPPRGDSAFGVTWGISTLGPGPAGLCMLCLVSVPWSLLRGFQRLHLSHLFWGPPRPGPLLRALQTRPGWTQSLRKGPDDQPLPLHPTLLLHLHPIFSPPAMPACPPREGCFEPHFSPIISMYIYVQARTCSDAWGTGEVKASRGKTNKQKDFRGLFCGMQ